MLTRSESVFFAPKNGYSPIRQVCMYPRSRFFFSFLAPPELSFPAAPSPPCLCFAPGFVCQPHVQTGAFPLEKWNEMQIHRNLVLDVVAAHVMDILLLYATMTSKFLFSFRRGRHKVCFWFSPFHKEKEFSSNGKLVIQLVVYTLRRHLHFFQILLLVWMYPLMRLWMPLQIQVLQLFFFHLKLLFKITYLELSQVYSFDSADYSGDDPSFF